MAAPAATRSIAEMLSNFILVLGMQVFIGNTGVLSFGHMAFAHIAAYATGDRRHPVAAKAKALPDIPFGLARRRSSARSV